MTFNEAKTLKRGDTVIVKETKKEAMVLKVDEEWEPCAVIKRIKPTEKKALVFCNNGRVYNQNQIDVVKENVNASA